MSKPKMSLEQNAFALIVRCGQRRIIREVVRPWGELWGEGSVWPGRGKRAVRYMERSNCVPQAVLDLLFSRKNKDTPPWGHSKGRATLILSIWDRKSSCKVSPRPGTQGVWSECDPLPPQSQQASGVFGEPGGLGEVSLGHYYPSPLPSCREKTRTPQISGPRLSSINYNPRYYYLYLVPLIVKYIHLHVFTCTFQEEHAV